jgi:predicted dehydrogenase
MPSTRRSFLLSAPSALAARSAVGGNDAVTAGIIGTGLRGNFLLQRALEIPGARFTYLCDSDPAALDRGLSLAARDRPKGVADYRKLLEARDVDAVFIATPCDLHREMIIAALEAGKHVYCEKPMAITPEDNRAIVDAAKKAKGILQIGFQRRYGARHREVVRRMHAGEIGKILFVRGQYYNVNDLPRTMAWKFKRDRFGDMIVEQAIHQFDVYNWLFQGHPLRACGFGSANLFVNDPPGRTIMDHYTVSYEYPGGAHLNFSHMYYAVRGLDGVGDVFYGSKGALDLPRYGAARFFDRAKTGPASTVDLPEDDTLSTSNAIQSFFGCIREKKQPFSNAEVGRLAALAVIMGLGAMVEDRIVEWKEVDV